MCFNEQNPSRSRASSHSAWNFGTSVARLAETIVGVRTCPGLMLDIPAPTSVYAIFSKNSEGV